MSDCETPHALEGLMVKHINQETRSKLASCLDPIAVTCGNWANLAGELGYTPVEISGIEFQQSDSGSNTQKLLTRYGLKLDSTIVNLRTQLGVINRPDAIDELDKAIPDIREEYRKEQCRQTPIRAWSQQPRVTGPMCTNCHTCNNQSEYHRFNSAPSGVIRHHAQHCCTHMSQRNGHQTPPDGHSSCRGRNRMASSPGASVNYQHCAGRLCISSSSPPQHLRNPRPQFSPTNSSIVSCPHKATDKILNSNPKEFGKMVSVEDNNLNYSMEGHAHSQIHGRLNDFSEVPYSSRETYVLRDAPVPVHEGIMREYCYNVPPLMPATNMDVGAEEEVFTSTDSSTSSNSYQGIVIENPTDVVAQRNQSSGTRRCGKTREMTRHPPRPNSKGFDNSGGKHQAINRSISMASSNGHMAELKISNSESKLVKHSGSHPSSLVHSHSVDQIKSSSGLSGSPNHVQKQPLTSTGNSRESQSNGVAMPMRVKPKLSEVCRGEVKVFVTYAADTPKHNKHVHDLYTCLQKNGFSPFLDSHDNELFNETWDQFFRSADFVLVCVSPLYKIITEGPSNQNGVLSHCDPINERLHTRHIYDLMMTEFRNDRQNRRFIPLICRGATQEHVPSSLQNTLIYKWPERFRDLLWKLTKPQERASPCARR